MSDVCIFENRRYLIVSKTAKAYVLIEHLWNLVLYL